nr:retrovirus-related Pol polyprotein from transposon TNT 1-94 [Tanacetum cinerariifolium]
MMKGSDIGEQEKKAKLFNKWEKFTSTDGELIESYYHRFMQLMNDLKRNKHFLKNIASNLNFLNNLQPEWKRHVTIVHQTKNLHEADFTQIYDFLKMNQEENVGGNGRNRFGQYVGQVAQIQQGFNAWQNGRIQCAQNAGVQRGGNQNGLVVVPEIANHSETGNVFATRAEARPRRMDSAYLQTQLLIAQKEEAGIQLQAEEFDFMAAAGDLDEIRKVNANCILMANLQQASTSNTQHDRDPIYDTDGSLSMVHSGGTVETSSTPNEEIRAHQETVYHNLVEQVAQKMALGYPNPSYLKKAQLKQQSLYNGKLLLKEHDPPVVYDSEETLELAQESHEKMRRLKKEIKPANYAKINYLSGVFVPQMTKSKEELFLSNVSNMVTVSKMISIPNEDLSDDTTPSVARKSKFVRDFKSLAKKADESLDKQKSLELKIERLLKASVSHDIMSIVQNSLVDVPSNLRTELDHTKEKLELYVIKREKEYAVLWNNWYTKCEECKYDKILYDKAYNDMQQKVKRLQTQFRDLKGKSSDTPSASNTLDPLNQKLESKIVELEFQVVNYEWTSVTPHVDKPKLSAATPRSKKLHASTQSHSVTQPNEFNVVRHMNVIAPRMLKINASQTPRVVQIYLWRVESGCSKHMTRNIKLLINFVWRFLGTVRFENDHIAAILGYGDLKWVNITITMVYLVEGLGHNLFSVGQFCDVDLEIAFKRNTCFIRDLDGVDLLKGNHSTNLYTINLYDMASASPIFLMARATPTKSWLWHQRLSHLNFDTINDLAKNDLVFGLPKFKYVKEHLYPSCEQGKSKRASHPPKLVLNSKQWLHLLHMDLCGPMRVESINGKRTEFKNQVLKEYFDNVGITHENSAAKTPQQNGVVECKNRTLVEAARTIKPDISYLHVFGALCYPKNDREDIDRLGAKGNIGFFIGYSANSVAYRVYNRGTRKIMETMNVTFDELSAMAFEQNSSRPRLQSMTFEQISSELELTYAPSTITPQRPSERDLDILFEPLYYEYLGGRPAEAPRAILVAPMVQNLQASTASMSFQDSAPAPTNSSNTLVSSHNADVTSQQYAQQQRNLTSSPTASGADNVLNTGFEGELFVNPFGTPSTESVVSSTQYVDPLNIHIFYQLYPHDYQWTRDHPLEQVIGEPSRPMTTLDILGFIFSEQRMKRQKKPDISYLHVFGALCYPKNDREDNKKNMKDEELERGIKQNKRCRINLRRTSITVFSAQSSRSSDAIATDSPYLLVLNTGASQSRQHGKE